MSGGFNGTNIIEGVVGDALYGALVAVTLWIARKLDRSRPRSRQSFLLIAAILTIAANVALYYIVGTVFPLFTTVLLIIVFAVFWLQIRQFWNVGLIGADQSISQGIDYRRSLRMCNNSLSFLGVGARKLTGAAPDFEQAMQRCNRTNRPIRFLLCRPDSQLLEKAAHGAGRPPEEYRRRVTESLRVIADLRNNRSWNIEVRFYEVPHPLFRLMFVDDWLCLASHYVFGEGDGSQWPQLHVRRSTTERDVNSLYHPFSEYFEQLWNEAASWDFNEYLREVGA